MGVLDRVKNPLSSISDKYPTYRDEPIKITKRWLDGKRIDDNAEGLWRVHDKLYDLSEFINRHPGGAEWLESTKGVDITELFETHHLTGKPEQLLTKFFVRDAKLPRNYKFTFNENGFYRTLKRRVAEKMPEVDMRPINNSKLTSDVMLGIIFATSIFAIKTSNLYLAMLTGLFLFWMLVIAHNFFHQKDNWRMLCFNLTCLNYRDWRISHAMSHHHYTNTYHDLEITLFEPHLQWIPRPKSTAQKIASVVLSPVVWIVLIWQTLIFRIVLSVKNPKEFKLDHLISFSLPLAMYMFGRADLHLVLKYWSVIISSCSFMLGLVGLNAGHHHPDVTHEGDEIESSYDFGIYQMAGVIDRSDIKGSHFLTLVTFGHHTLHHMFPTLDHAILPQLHETFIETCKEFQLELREHSWWPLIAGQFQQLTRTRPKTLKEMNQAKGN